MRSLIKKIRDRTRELPLFRYLLPQGADFFFDIKRRLPSYRTRVIFDVGANFGQSAESYVRRAPGAKVYCFEPIAATFQQLQRDIGKHRNVQCFQLALSSAKQVRTMQTEGPPDMFKLIDEQPQTPGNDSQSAEQVETDTLSNFCKSNEVSNISLLKIDTEGHEMDVLQGAAEMLESQRIDFVEVEAGMNPSNTRHVPLETLKAHLESQGYFLFGVYEQMHEWLEKKPHLRRANPVFISRKLAGLQ